jgi:predicted phage-related endonuclease
MLEPFVKAEFTKRTGIDITPVPYILQSEEYPFMFANLDGLCEHPDYGTCIFEAKTASAYKAGEWEDGIPEEYLLQVQHYLAVTGCNGVYIAVLIGGNSFKWRFIERDNELIEMLIKLEADFWGHVQSLTTPQLDGSDASAKFIKGQFPDSIPSSKIELPASAADLIQQYDAACEQLEKASEQKQYAENLIKQMLGKNETGIIGNRIITWKNSTKTSQRRFSIKKAA